MSVVKVGKMNPNLEGLKRQAAPNSCFQCINIGDAVLLSGKLYKVALEFAFKAVLFQNIQRV